MTTYYAATAASGAADGSSVNDPFTLTSANATLQPGDTCYLADGTYTTFPNPGVNGTAANPIRYIGLTDENTPLTSPDEFLNGITTRDELYTAMGAEQTARSVIIDVEQFLPTKGYFSCKAIDFSVNRVWRFDAVNSADAHHIVMDNCRSILPFYDKLATLTNTNHSFRATQYITWSNCHLWPPAKISELGQPDLTRIKGGTEGCIFINSIFWPTAHSCLSFRGQNNDDVDFNTTLASRNAAHDNMAYNCLWVGWSEHPIDFGGGAYNNAVVLCRTVETSRWDSFGDTDPEPTSALWSDQVIGTVSGGSSEAVNGEAFRSWSGHTTFLYCSAIGAGAGDRTNPGYYWHGATNALASYVDDAGDDWFKRREIESVYYVHCSFSDNYGGGAFLGTQDNTFANERFYSPWYINCFFDDNHRTGDEDNDPNEWFQSSEGICVWMEKNGGPWLTADADEIGGMNGCLIGRNGAEKKIRYTDGSLLTVSAAQSAAWTEFPITNCATAGGDPLFAGKYDLTPTDGSPLIDAAVAIATMVGAGTSQTNATITNPRAFPIVQGISYDDFDETNNQYSMTVYIGPAGGPFTANTITVNDYSGDITLGTAATWSNGDEIWPLFEPDSSGNLDVGAVQVNLESQPPPGPTPVGNLLLAVK